MVMLDECQPVVRRATGSSLVHAAKFDSQLMYSGSKLWASHLLIRYYVSVVNEQVQEKQK
jgi:hypothetical protein